MKITHRCARALFAVLLSLVHLPVLSASFNVLPVRVYMVPQNPVSSVQVTNRSDQAVMIQSKTVDWKQPDGTQVLTPTNDIIVSPPIFELQAGDSQVVRIAVNADSSISKEQTYRLFLTEVPMDQAETKNTSGVDVALRLSLPIFVTPTTSSVDLSASIRGLCSDQDNVNLQVSNVGSKHVMLLKMQINKQDGAPVKEVFQPAYLLTDSKRNWDLQLTESPITDSDHLNLSYETVTGDKGLIPIEKSETC